MLSINVWSKYILWHWGSCISFSISSPFLPLSSILLLWKMPTVCWLTAPAKLLESEDVKISSKRSNLNPKSGLKHRNASLDQSHAICFPLAAARKTHKWISMNPIFQTSSISQKLHMLRDRDLALGQDSPEIIDNNFAWLFSIVRSDRSGSAKTEPWSLFGARMGPARPDLVSLVCAAYNAKPQVSAKKFICILLKHASIWREKYHMHGLVVIFKVF